MKKKPEPPAAAAVAVLTEDERATKRAETLEKLTKEGLPTLWRDFEMTARLVVPEKRDGEEQRDSTFEIAISSEFPVERWWGKEILDHSAGAVDLSRAQRGLSFLAEHRSADLVGLIENVRVDEDKKLRGVVRFSKNAPAQAIRQDMTDGIRRFISVGYAIREYKLESSDETGDTYRAMRWTPLEASIVAVPADPTVGVNRSENETRHQLQVRSEIPAAKPKSKSEVTVASEIVVDERKAAAEIFRLGREHKIEDKVVDELVDGGATVETASTRFLAIIKERGAKPLPQPGAETERRDEFVLTPDEESEYNLARAIMVMARNREASENGRSSARQENCLELEISDQMARNWRGPLHGGLLVPYRIRQLMTKDIIEKLGEAGKRFLTKQIQKRAGLDTKTSTKGSELIFTEPGDFLNYLYNMMRLRELGARVITGLRENVAYPKQTGKISGSWVAENPGSDVAESNLTLGQVPASPHTYQSTTSYSRQLLNQGVVDVDAMVRADIAMDQAQALDIAGISGAGTNAPLGITNATGVQAYNMIADAGNGGAPSWDDIVIMTQKLEDVNANQLGDGAWLTSPPCKSKLKRLARLANTTALPIWDDDNTVDGYTARSSNNVPKNGTKGTGTNLSTLIRGVFQSLIVSMWGPGFELIVDPYSKKKQAMIELTSFMQADITLTYPEAFVVAKNVITT